MTSRRNALVAVVLAAGLVSSYVAYAAYGGPDGIRIPYNGVLESSGALVSGDVAFNFKVFNQEVGGSSCYDSAPITATVTSGRFAVVVGPVTASCIVNRDVFMEVAADDGSGLVTLGRQRIHPALAAVSSGNGDFAVGGALAVTGNVTATSVYASSTLDAPSITWPAGELKNDANGGIELGAAGRTPFIDFHGGAATNADYDARLILTSADQLRLSGAELHVESGLRFGDGTTQTTAAKSLVCTYAESAFVTGNGTLEAYQNVPSGYTMTGGGCREDATGERQLMRNQPGGPGVWYCMSHDEDNLYTGSLKAYAFGCKLQ